VMDRLKRVIAFILFCLCWELPLFLSPNTLVRWAFEELRVLLVGTLLALYLRDK